MTTPDPVRVHLDWLGRRVREKVTGARGVITSVSFDLYGCVHGLLTPARKPDGDKEHDSIWYDVKRLEADPEQDAAKVLEPPRYFLVAPGLENGPADKPLPPGA